METAQIPPGTMLDDKYRVESLLAIGGMGAVYVGTHTLLKKRVAIKVLRTELADHAEAVHRFQREAVAASQIGHDNIVEVTDLGMTPGGVAFLVMEYLEGESLAQLIESHAPLPTARACAIAIEVLSAIDAAHAAGIVHRDLKPANLFLARKSRGEMVKILDFGISRMRRGDDGDHRLTRTGFVLGTPSYMSPEQACGNSDVGECSDIYSVAVILYEMLSGRVPFEGENYNQLIFNILLGDYLPLREFRREVPEGLDLAIRRAMSLSPAERYQRAALFARELIPFSGVPAPEFTRPASESSSRARMIVTPNRSMAAMASPTAETMAATQQDLPVWATPERVMRAEASAAANAAGTSPGFAGTELAIAPGKPLPPVATTGKKGRTLLLVALAALLIAGGGAATYLGMRDAEDPGAVALAAAPVERETTEEPLHAELPPAEPLQADAQAAEIHSVRITFVTTPPDAAIFIDGAPVAGNPLTIARDSETHLLEIRRDGYVTHNENVRFDVDQRLQFALAREQRRPTREPADDSSTRRAPDKRGKSRLIHDSPYE